MTETKPKGKDAAADRKDPALRTWIGLGVGAGIGSAALAAALLYASRSGRARR